MYCIYCSSKIADDSSFCEFCGKSLKDTKKKTEKEEKAEEKKPHGKQTFWEKFAEVFDAEGEKRKQYEDLTSPASWELINRLAGNTFADFMEQNPTVHKKPHRDVDLVKNELTICLGGGYYMWIAEQIYNNHKLKQPIIASVDNLVKDWKKADVFVDHQKFIDNIPTMVSDAMEIFYSWRIKTLLEEAKSLHDLPHELIEKIKSFMSYLLLLGYAIGSIEEKYRK